MEGRRQNSLIVSFAAPQNHRPGPVTEEDAPGAMLGIPLVVLVRQWPFGLTQQHPPGLLAPRLESGMHLGADQRHGPGPPALNQGVGQIEAVEEPTALLTDIEGGNM